MRLSDTIEEFIKMMLGQDEPQIELKRNELAEHFSCAPSQINYVLSTRFTPDHGYVIESRRGGGGFIRIIRINREEGELFSYMIGERIGNTIDLRTAQILLQQLAEQNQITRDESEIMFAALTPQALSIPIPETLKDNIRARILRSMLIKAAQKTSA
ncbi:MAG: CtsR family transcriptional regulator [Clostridiales bacterium]|jgi:transcriptional regulator CtsR|nr:CtsR family transcriptional regulator [Clostridiales bacterium]